MNDTPSSPKRHRINLDVDLGFEGKIKLLAAKWRVKSNVAVQRAVEQALARKVSDDEKAILYSIRDRLDEVVRHLFP